MVEDVLTQEEKDLIASVTGEAVAASEVIPQQMTKEDHLLMDMQKLVGIDNTIAVKEEEEDTIWVGINDFKKENGFDLLLDKIVEDKSDLRKQFNLLKKDIALRAEQIYTKTKNVDPCLGVKVTMRKNRALEVDPVAAIEWAINNEHVTLLLLDEEKYADLLETGVIKDQPGEVDNSKIPAVKISLKPFEED